MTWEAYNEVINAPHRAKLSHELIAAAASYEAMKAWEQHKERNGENVDHARRNEIMAAAAGFFIDRMIETKGLDAIDRYRAREQATAHYAQHYESYGYNGYGNAPYGNAPYGGYPNPNPYGGAPYGYNNYGYNNYDGDNGRHHHHHHHHHRD